MSFGAEKFPLTTPQMPSPVRAKPPSFALWVWFFLSPDLQTFELK